MAYVLIADDDQSIRAVLTILLREEGHDVVEARDGQEALDIVRDRRPDLLLLDLRMPRLDGAGVLQAISTPSPPVILLSASPQAVAVARQHGVRLVAKPFDADVLLQAVSGLLSTAST